jgi:hypothetical protein
MITIEQHEIDRVKDINIELESIKHTFVSAIERRESFQPFAIYFKDSTTKSFYITSRPVVDNAKTSEAVVADYYTAISEMLFAYSALRAEAVVLAVEVIKEIDSVQLDTLDIYLACDEFCTIYSFPYRLDGDKLVWIEDKFNSYSIEKLESIYDTGGKFHANLEIFEALYLHTHIDFQLFEFSKLKTFYDYNNYHYVDLEKARIQKQKEETELVQ